MDIVTKTEKPIPNTIAYNRILQWVNDDIVYILEYDRIIKVNISEYEAETVYTGDTTCRYALRYPYMFVSDLKGSRIYNMEDGSVREYDDSIYDYCAAAISSDSGYKVLLVYNMSKINNAFYHEAVVLDLDDRKSCAYQ